MKIAIIINHISDHRNWVKLFGPNTPLSLLSNITYGAPANDNRLASISGGSSRTFTHDAAGNVTYDNRSGQGYGYTYDAANRMESFSINGVVQAEYKYNYLGQQAIRTLTQTGQVINSVYGPDGKGMYKLAPLNLKLTI